MEEPPSNKFYGLSSLRAKEKAELPKTAQAKAMEEYLKKYTDGAAGPTDFNFTACPTSLYSSLAFSSYARILEIDAS